MNRQIPPPPPLIAAPTRVRYGVLLFACSLAMITYLDRVCFGTVAPFITDEFGLGPQQVGLLFTAFAFAYAVFEVPSGWLGDVFGPRKTLTRIVLWWSLFTALTGAVYGSVFGPSAAFFVMLAVRFCFGMGEAGAFPNIARAFHNWFPATERGSAQGAVWMAGRFAGGVSPLLVTALIWERTAPDGTTQHLWRHVFWLFGLLGVAWVVMFRLWFKDRPEHHAGVNAAEIALITGKRPVLFPLPDEPTPPVRVVVAESSSVAVVSAGEPVATAPEGRIRAEGPTPTPAADSVGELEKPVERQSSDLGHVGVPWGRLLTSTNLWALCLLYFCSSYGWYFNITYLPGYLQNHFDVTAKTYGTWTFGFMAGAPLLFGSLACLGGGILSDAFIRRTGNLRWGRRLFGVVGHSICAGCYFLCIFASNPWWFVAAVALAAFWNDMTMGATWAACLDIGKKYSGIVAGCMNTIGNLGGAAAGYFTGWVLERFAGDPKLPHEGANTVGWTVNFVSFSLVYLVAVALWFRVDASEPIAPDHE